MSLDIVILGLSLSSSWGNGHATTYRALVAALADRGLAVTFLERDQPWYAAARDLPSPDYCNLIFYGDPSELGRHAERIRNADLVIVGSYVPDGQEVAAFALASALGVTAFYDIDTPITVAALADEACAYMTRALAARFDLYLSFTGGPMLGRLETRFGVRRARTLWCGVDALRLRPTSGAKRYDLSYLGTWAADRAAALDRLLLEPARRRPDLRAIVAGPLYPADMVWPTNVDRLEHLPPEAHAQFYGASRLTLNLTRAEMLRAGFSPSVRLFEAGACGAAIATDVWPGINTTFAPGREIALVESAEDVLALLDGPQEGLVRMGEAAKSRVLADHTGAARAAALEHYFREVVDADAALSA